MSYIEEEESRILRERKTPMSKRIERLQVFSIVLAIVLSFTAFNLTAANHKDKCKARMYPKTWSCTKCGYNNYEGINSCAVCGKSK